MQREIEFDVDCFDLKLENYQLFLCKFDEWIKAKREINLNFILKPEKKLEFEVELDNSSSVYHVGFYENPLYTNTVLLQKSAAVISSFKFILNNNSIESLVLKLNPLTTNWGKILSDMVVSSNKPKLLQQIVDGQVINFYFLINKSAS